MFNKVLAHFLDLCKQVETGEGYHGHMDDAKPKEKRVMQAQVGARHQMLNRWLKNWDILSQVFRHHISLDRDVFQACVVVAQLTMEKMANLFSSWSTRTRKTRRVIK